MKDNAELAGTFSETAKALWIAHQDAIQDLLAKTEDRKVKVGFTATVDCSGNVPRLAVKIAWAERHTDETVVDLDADQMKLFNE